MKRFIPLVILLLTSFTLPCDPTVYTWGKQTAGDSRFAAFPVLKGKKSGPVYPGGDKALDRLIREKLLISEEASRHTFNLNYYFTVGCDGSIENVVVLGDPVVAEWTNISNILVHTRGWQPATKSGASVKCIYFRTLFVHGPDYSQKLLKE